MQCHCNGCYDKATLHCLAADHEPCPTSNHQPINWQSDVYGTPRCLGRPSPAANEAKRETETGPADRGLMGRLILAKGLASTSRSPTISLMRDTKAHGARGVPAARHGPHLAVNGRAVPQHWAFHGAFHSLPDVTYLGYRKLRYSIVHVCNLRSGESNARLDGHDNFGGSGSGEKPCAHSLQWHDEP